MKHLSVELVSEMQKLAVGLPYSTVLSPTSQWEVLRYKVDNGDGTDSYGIVYKNAKGKLTIYGHATSLYRDVIKIRPRLKGAEVRKVSP